MEGVDKEMRKTMKHKMSICSRFPAIEKKGKGGRVGQRVRGNGRREKPAGLGSAGSGGKRSGDWRLEGERGTRKDGISYSASAKVSE